MDGDGDGVRRATEGDRGRLSELARALAEEMEGRRGAAEAAADGWREPVADHVGRWLADGTTGDHRAWVADLEDRVCAFALAHLQPWDDGSRRGVLDACFVEEAARGRGLGPRLLQAVVEWLAGEGCSGIDGVALPGDRTAKNFYEGAGFKARLLTMYRAVD